MSTLKAINVTHPFSVTNNLVLNSDGTVSDSKGGIRDVPIVTQSSVYSLTQDDAGKVVSTNSNVVVPGNIFTPGQNITVFNRSTSSISIQASGVNFILAAQSNNQNKILTANGIAAIICISTNTFVLSGVGLS